MIDYKPGTADEVSVVTVIIIISRGENLKE